MTQDERTAWGHFAVALACLILILALVFSGYKDKPKRNDDSESRQSHVQTPKRIIKQ